MRFLTVLLILASTTAYAQDYDDGYAAMLARQRAEQQGWDAFSNYTNQQAQPAKPQPVPTQCVTSERVNVYGQTVLVTNCQ